MNGTIYILTDPRDQQCRYVGLTTGPLIKRLRSHLNRAVSVPQNRKCVSWIRSLMAVGLKPEITSIEESSDVEEAERFWIAYLRFVGCDLTNMKNGGEVHVGSTHSDDVRRRLSEIAKKNFADPARREASAKYAREQWKNPEFREKRKKLTARLCDSPEWIRNQSEKKRLLWATDDYRKKVTESHQLADHRTGALNMWQRPEYRAAQAAARARRKA